ncbi:MAG TPA: hypothetical protein VFW14_14335 [Gaiellales bacterium]|nr:hypothetical protein [Gaiellales bacterium]
MAAKRYRGWLLPVGAAALAAALAIAGVITWRMFSPPLLSSTLAAPRRTACTRFGPSSCGRLRA